MFILFRKTVKNGGKVYVIKYVTFNTKINTNNTPAYARTGETFCERMSKLSKIFREIL
jgi:hypothetical protein